MVGDISSIMRELAETRTTRRNRSVLDAAPGSRGGGARRAAAKHRRRPVRRPSARKGRKERDRCTRKTREERSETARVERPTKTA